MTCGNIYKQRAHGFTNIVKTKSIEQYFALSLFLDSNRKHASCFKPGGNLDI